MKFEQFEYEHIDESKYENSFLTLIEKLNNASSPSAAIKVFDNINTLRVHFESMRNICMVRHTQNTKAEYYKREQDYFDRVNPMYEQLVDAFYKKIESSRFKNALEEEYGSQLFTLIKTKSKAFHAKNKPLQEKENKLMTQYDQLLSSFSLKFRGEDCKLSQINAYLQSGDRNIRKSASEVKWSFFEQNKSTIGSIFSELVGIRHKKAINKGYPNFVDMGYFDFGRSDYDKCDVSAFRELIIEHVVPLAKMLQEKQRKRIGVDVLKYYDMNYSFKTGNPNLLGDQSQILTSARKMFNEMPADLSTFFDFMLKSNLIDVESRKNKSQGGYCEYISKYSAPFIFGNCNGTFHDTLLLTHELGHAFQVYLSRRQKAIEYYWPTAETCEIHSMAMEYFTLPWIHHFFGEDSDKYLYLKLSGSLLFLPVCAQIDEFQHLVYEHPEASVEEVNAFWSHLSDKYIPGIDYDGNAYLENGGGWAIIPHIFMSPFYYIDYGLAEICALQYWKWIQQSESKAWESYLQLCRAGGSKSFLQLLKLSKLESPFKKTTFLKTVQYVNDFLNSIDDSRF